MPTPGRSVVASGLLILLLVLLLPGPARILGTVTTAHGDPGAPDTVAADLDRVRAWLREGRNAEADSLARLMVRRAEAAGEPLALAHALDARAMVLLRTAAISDPEPVELARRALRIKEGLPEVDEADLADSAGRLGQLLCQRSLYDEAESHLLRCLELRRRAPVDSLALAAAHDELATLYTYRSEYERAENHYRTSIAIGETLLGPDHPDLARKTYLLGRLYYNASRYRDARPWLERALALSRSGLGPRHYGVAYVLNSLAMVEEELGWIPRARTCYEEALSIARESLGEDHALVVSLRSNLARLDLSVGDARTALAGFEAVLEPTRAAYGDDHLYVAVVLAGMADAHALLGDLEAALRLDREALEVFGATRDSTHVAVVMRRHRMGKILRRLGRHEEAERIQTAALQRLLEAGESRSVDIVEVRHELGRLLLAERREAEALEELHEARRACADLLSPEHPTAAEILVDTAAAQLALGRPDSSLACALSAEEISRRHAAVIFLALSQSEALHYASRRVSAADALIRLAREGSEPGRCWEALLNSRAQVLATVGLRQRILHLSADPAVRERAEAFAAASRRCAHLLLTASDDPASRAATLAEARRDLDEAERAWVAAGGEGLQDLETPAMGLDELRSLLPPRSALVGCFVAEAPARYTAFVLAGQEPWVSVVDLGPAAPVDDAVRAWMDEARRGAAGGREADYRRAGADLRRLVWDPLRPHLEGVETVLVVPAGQLHRVHLATLPTGEDGYLVEGPWRFHYLTRELDLARPPAAGEGSGLLLALGAPDYDRRGEAPPAAGTVAPGLRGEPSPCPSLQSLQFGELPASGLESEEVGRLWRERDQDHRTLLLTAAEATEAACKRRAPEAEVLHLATHGFVLGDECTAPAGGRGLGAVGYLDEPAPAVETSPLRLAGLALAGANLRDRAPAGGEDGILTAEEIATLDLSGLRWAVLSACDTGGGEIHSAEGILGLRRAFQLAGARSLVMSLWPVRDEIAREWMVRFYRACAVEETTIVQAVQAASLDLLRKNRREGASCHPAFWGAFVGCGDWR